MKFCVIASLLEFYPGSEAPDGAQSAQARVLAWERSSQWGAKRPRCRSSVSKLLQFVLFAYDTNIFCSDVNISDLCKNVSSELDKLNIWFAVNKLSLNVSKTNFILFGNRKYNGEVDIKINGINIERVYVTKFLGVLIDHQLNWKEHINHTINKNRMFFRCYPYACEIHF